MSSHPHPAVGSRKKKAGFAVLLGSLCAFGPLTIDMYLPSLPSLGRELSASTSSVQLTLTACLLGLALGQLIAGPISDSRGRRLPLMIGVGLFTIASALCVVAPSVPVLVALRFLQGLGGSAGLVISRAVVRDLYSGSELVRFFAMLTLVFGLAPIVAPILGGQILQFTTWRGVFIMLTLAGGILLAAAALFLKETHSHEKRRKSGFKSNLRVFSELLADREFFGYVLAGGLAIAVILVYVAGSPFVLQEIYSVTPQGFSLCFGGISLGILVAGQTSARLVDRFGAATLLTAGLVAMAFGASTFLVAVLAGAGLPLVLASLFVTISSAGFIGPNATALAMETHADKAGSASALLGMFQFLIGAAVAPLVGIAGSETAVPMAVLMTTLALGAIAVRLTLAHPADEREQRSERFSFFGRNAA